MERVTPLREASAELEVKGSRFIAVLAPIARFGERLEEIKRDHRKASHHVTATRRMTDTDAVEDHANDDGEPAGTSGMPTLKTMMGAGIVDAGIIVTRYFGGTKLGTGGLARAYSGVAVLAIDGARLVPWHRIVMRSVSAGFAEASALEQRLASLDLTVIDRVFTEDGVTPDRAGARGAGCTGSAAGIRVDHEDRPHYPRPYRWHSGRHRTARECTPAVRHRKRVAGVGVSVTRQRL